MDVVFFLGVVLCQADRHGPSSLNAAWVFLAPARMPGTCGAGQGTDTDRVGSNVRWLAGPLQDAHAAAGCL